jgi:hypothetical protein
MPGLLIFSLRLLVELLLAPVRALRKTLMPGRAHERVAPVASAPEPPPPPPPPRKRPPRQRSTPRRAEPTRGQVAAMRETEREAETGGRDSVGAQVHLDEPWPGYDKMGLEEVLTRLQGASDVELAVVRAYEREHEARQAVLLAAGDEA